MQLLLRTLVTLLLVFGLSLPALAAPRVVFNGKILQMDASPTIEKGTTLVPLRSVFEALGAKVLWDDETQSITASDDDTTVTLAIGEKMARVNGKAVTLPVAARVVDGRTLVPLRFVSESFGAAVDWDARQELAIISTPEKPISVDQSTPADKLLKVHFINVGTADATYISLPDKKNILIDAGIDENYFREKPMKVVNYLEEQGVQDIDLLVSSLPLEDYTGSLKHVFSHLNVKRFIESGLVKPSKEYSDLVLLKKEADVEQAGHQHFDYDGISFDILTSVQGGDDDNSHSVICRLKYGDVSFLFTGGANLEEENSLDGDISADILKVADHGSADSLSTDFLQRVNPRVAVIPVGQNPFSLPSGSTLDRLKGINVLRTDEKGSIVISTDGKKYDITTEKGTAMATPAESTPVKVYYIGDIDKNVLHKSTCELAKELKESNIVHFETGYDAKVNGFVPCKVCNP